jgi:hypothetical protein
VFYIFVVEQILDSVSIFHALIFGFVSGLVSSLLILILLAPGTYALVFAASCVLTEAVGPNFGHIWELASGASAKKSISAQAFFVCFPSPFFFGGAALGP